MSLVKNFSNISFTLTKPHGEQFREFDTDEVSLTFICNCLGQQSFPTSWGPIETKKSTPLKGDMPNLSNFSGCSTGYWTVYHETSHSKKDLAVSTEHKKKKICKKNSNITNIITSCSSRLTFSRPPISCQLTLGTSTTCTKNWEKLKNGNMLYISYLKNTKQNYKY